MARTHATAAAATDEMVARIGERFRPWRIVLFGSRARGDARADSDYDLFVEVDVPADSLVDAEDGIWLFTDDFGRQAEVHLEPAGQIERERDDPGTIEWDVAREGILLYADPSAPTQLAPVPRVSEPSAEPPKSTWRWVEVGDTDLRAARKLAEEGQFFGPVCFHCQQAGEKYLKALLVSRRLRPRRTHDLKKLLADLRAGGCELPGLDKDCKLLSTHAVTPRYSLGLRAGDARKALAAAERLVAQVTALLPERESLSTLKLSVGTIDSSDSSLRSE
jgi:HEPN domain-containing protein/predicted nucleotidyltransferase